MSSPNHNLNFTSSITADTVPSSSTSFNPYSTTTTLNACSPSTDPLVCISKQTLPEKENEKEKEPGITSRSLTHLSSTPMKINPKDSLLSLPFTQIPSSITSTSSFSSSSSSPSSTTTTAMNSTVYDFISVFVRFQPTSCSSHFNFTPYSNPPTSSLLSTSEQRPMATTASHLASTPTSPCHTYVLSRFLISRYLTAIQIEKDHAMWIASSLKKSLVDQYFSSTSSFIYSIDSAIVTDNTNTNTNTNVHTVQVSQTQLEQTLFQLILHFGYSSLYCHRFQLMQQWHQQRRPLLIFLIGTKGLHKSFVAQTLAERLNISSVVKTEVIAELMRSMTSDPPTFSCWSFVSQPSIFLKAYTEECRLVQQGLQHDLDKCLKEGRSMILVGPHLDFDLVKAIYHHWYSYSSSSCCSTLHADTKHEQDTLKMEGLIVPFLLTKETILKASHPNTSSPFSSSSQGLTSICGTTSPAQTETQSYSTATTSTPLSCSLTDFEECCDELQDHLLHQFHQFASVPSPCNDVHEKEVEVGKIASFFQSSFKTLPFNLYSHPEQQLNEMHSHVLNLIEKTANVSFSPPPSF